MKFQISFNLINFQNFFFHLKNFNERAAHETQAKLTATMNFILIDVICFRDVK